MEEINFEGAFGILENTAAKARGAGGQILLPLNSLVAKL